MLTVEQSSQLWDLIRKEGCLFYNPYPGVVNAVSRLHQLVDVFAVTAPMKKSPRWTSDRDQWCEEVLGIPFERMVHTKAKYIFSGDMLVDDKPQNIEEWAEEHAGVPVLWTQPYNKNHHFNPAIERRVVRTNSWEDIIAYCL
jgi:5'(3')-deoxyribonucleotidase